MRRMRQVDCDHWLLGEIWGDMVDRELHALVMHLIPLFDAGKSALTIACPRNKVEDSRGFFRGRG